MGNIVLNFNEILNECGVDIEPPDEALRKLAGLEEFYDSGDVVEVYNYILLNNDDYNLLSDFIIFVFIVKTIQ